VPDVEAKTRGTRKGLAALDRKIQRAATQIVKAAVEVARKHAKTTDLWQDGKTRDTRKSIRGGMIGPYLGFVEAGGAAHFLEYGTTPHIIMAKGRALRFEVAGQVLYRKWVSHPGTRPRPFMREASLAGEQAIPWAAEVYLSQAIQSAR
jgi:hypothetical protein